MDPDPHPAPHPDRLLISEVLASLDYLSCENRQQFYQAYLLSATAHEGQCRRSGEPYVFHPIAVAHILSTMRLDHEALCAALLHDVVEDTSTSPDEIEQQFGKNVRHIVEGVSKLSGIRFSSKLEAKAENFNRLLAAALADVRVILVKLADRLHNLRTLDSLRPDKRRRIAAETLELYTPLAGRLGLHNLRTELEALAFANLYPLRQRLLASGRARLRSQQQEIIQQITQHLAQGFKQARLDVELDWHEKPLWQIFLARKRTLNVHQPPAEAGLPARFETLLAGLHLRILVSQPEDCYRAIGIVHSLYKPRPQCFKDYIAIPRSNGYQALHTTVYGPHNTSLKTRISTHQMRVKAQYGMASYWNEHPGALPKQETVIREWLNPLLELHQASINSIEFLEHFKNDSFTDEIYALTPSGKVIRLPAGATPLDFAYAVHTDIGDHYAGARLDGHETMPSTPLRNGQMVAIRTEASAHPEPRWLNYAVTSRARLRIQQVLRRLPPAEAAALGRTLLIQELFTLGLTWTDLAESALQVWLIEQQLPSLEQLFIEVCRGTRSSFLVAAALSRLATPRAHAPAVLRRKAGPLPPPLELAACCRPLPPEALIGIPKQPSGLLIHRHDCPALHASLQQRAGHERLAWGPALGDTFVGEFHLYARNQPGMLAAITQVIGKAEANIENVDFPASTEDYKLIEISLKVRNLAHLETILQHLARIPGITQVTRGRAPVMADLD